MKTRTDQNINLRWNFLKKFEHCQTVEQQKNRKAQFSFS